jgi:hypothetical protein
MSQSMTSLDLIHVASPCPASWDAMKGDERVRFCQQCKLQVYNLSEMSREEAEEFVSRREGRTCVKFFRRADGTVLTKDCPVGVRALRQRFVRAVAALAGLCVALVSGTLLGGVFNRLLPSGIKRPADVFAGWIDPTSRLTSVMGGCPPPIACPPPPHFDSSMREPAETPLPPPTPEQLQEIQRRLAE